MSKERLRALEGSHSEMESRLSWTKALSPVSNSELAPTLAEFIHCSEDFTLTQTLITPHPNW